MERSPSKSKNNILVFPNRVANLEIQNTGYNMLNQEHDESLDLTTENHIHDQPKNSTNLNPMSPNTN